MIGGPQLGLVFALLSAALFGINIVSAQIAGAAGLSGPLMVLWRVVLMLVFVCGIMAWRGTSFALGAEHRKSVIVMGLVSALVGSAYLSSVAFIPVTIAVVILYTFPVLVVMAEPFVNGGRFGRVRFALAIIAFIGVVLVIGPGFETLDWRGLALAMIASIGAAIQFFAASRSAAMPLMPKLFWIHIIVLPMTLVILFVTGGFKPVTMLALAPYASAITIIAFIFGFALQVAALARIAPGSAALVFSLEPVVAALAAALMLGEAMVPLQYLGAALVLGTVVANVVREQKASRSTSL
jgi:drug/metabolite transporter (DMT)-like permease